MSDGILVLDHGKETRCLPEEKKKDVARQERCNEKAAKAAKTETEGIQDIESADIAGITEELTLEECLGMLRNTDLYLNADLKEPHLEDAVLALAEREGFDPGRIVFTGCIGDAASMVQRIGRAGVYANPEEIDAAFYRRLSILPMQEKGMYLEDLLQRIHSLGISVINVNYRICDEALLESCRRNGLRLSLWTVDDTQAAKRLLEPGVRERIENITTNRPVCLRKLGW